MIKIKTSDLKTFLKRSRSIKQPGIMPILSYFKMDCKGEIITCTDTNMHTYLLHEMSGEFEKNGSYLIDRKTIQSVIDTTNSESIIFTPKGKKIFISDDFGGSTSNNGFQTDDPTLYPKMPEQNKTTSSRIGPDLMAAIQVAKHYCVSDKTASNIDAFESVHLTGTPDYTEVFGCDKFLMYLNRIEGDSVSLMITPENCDMLNGFTEATHFSCGNYDFYECGATTYGFVKLEYKTPNYSPLISGINREKYFIIEKQRVLDYCNRVKNINPSNVYPECEIREAGKDKVLFYYNNTDHDVNCEVIFDAVKNFDIVDFKFNANQFIQLIGSLPYGVLKFVQDGNRFILLNEEDKEYIGLIQGLQ